MPAFCKEAKRRSSLSSGIPTLLANSFTVTSDILIDSQHYKKRNYSKSLLFILLSKPRSASGHNQLCRLFLIEGNNLIQFIYRQLCQVFLGDDVMRRKFEGYFFRH